MANKVLVKLEITTDDLYKYGSRDGFESLVDLWCELNDNWNRPSDSDLKELLEEIVTGATERGSWRGAPEFNDFKAFFHWNDSGVGIGAYDEIVGALDDLIVTYIEAKAKRILRNRIKDNGKDIDDARRA